MFQQPGFTRRVPGFNPYMTPRPGLDRYVYGDGLFSLIGAGLKAVGSAVAKVVPKHTIVGKVLGAVGLGGAAGAAASAVQGALAPTTLPALPTAQSMGITSLPGVPTPSQAVGSGIGGAITSMIPWFKGPGGKLQMPWSDPATLKGLKSPFVLDDSYLRPTYRAPKGYVVVHDNTGKPYPMWKPVAKAMGMWSPARKPPISAGDWNKYQTAQTVEKKLRKIASRAIRKRSSRTVNTKKR